MTTHYSQLPTGTPFYAAAFAAILLTISAEAVVVSTVSIDLEGTSQPDSLTSTHVAGVVPADQWYPVPTLTGGFGGIQDNLGSGSMNIGWNAPTAGVITGSTSTIGDQDMMEGYLQTRVDPAGAFVPITVQFSGINLGLLGWTSYDIYVYSDQGLPAPGQADITLTPSPGAPVGYLHAESSPGYGAGTSSYLDSQTGSLVGNYVKYSGLTAPTFFIQVDPVGASGSAALNGFQIVGQTVPEPSSALLAISALALCLRRSR